MAKKRCCVFTFVKNERVFLPIWLKYYSRFFNEEDIYILDHESNDGSIEGALRTYKVNVIKLYYELYDQGWRSRIARRKQAELLQFYEYVLYSDADEIIIPNPKKFRDLADYITKLNKDCVICTGYDLIHMTKEEPPIDLNRPILEQRSYWYASYMVDKPLLSRKPLGWRVGFHFATNSGNFRDKDLWLIHLHKLDFDICLNKHKEVTSMKWSERSIKWKWGIQLRITKLDEFTKFFYPKKLKKMNWQVFIKRTCFFLFWVLLKGLRPRRTASWHIWSQFHIPIIVKVPRALKISRII